MISNTTCVYSHLTFMFLALDQNYFRPVIWSKSQRVSYDGRIRMEGVRGVTELHSHIRVFVRHLFLEQIIYCVFSKIYIHTILILLGYNNKQMLYILTGSLSFHFIHFILFLKKHPSDGYTCQILQMTDNSTRNHMQSAHTIHGDTTGLWKS